MWLSPLGSTEVPDTARVQVYFTRSTNHDSDCLMRFEPVSVVKKIGPECASQLRYACVARTHTHTHTHTETLVQLDSITFCDERTGSQTLQLCEKIYHLHWPLKKRKRNRHKKKTTCFQLTSVYTGWGHRLNHFKHPKESPTPKVNRYRY